MLKAQGKAILLSIIVPVYNVAAYLRQCLDSIAAQTLNPESYEVLLVDDRSDDGSLEICCEYARQHTNFQVIPLKNHTPGGCGTPSNIAMRAAQGAYIGFVDSDDYILPEMFEELLRKAVNNDADISLCDQYRLDMATNSVKGGPDTDAFMFFALPGFAQLSAEEKKIKYLQLDCPPWLKIYRASFIKKHALAFPEGEFYFEDVVFHWKSLFLASRIVHTDKKLIMHRVNRPGQTIAASGRELLGIISIFTIIKAFLQQNNCYAGSYRHVFMNCAARRYSWMLSRLDANLCREFYRQAGCLFQDFSCAEIHAYCKNNKVRLRTGVRHYLLLRDHWHLARLLPPLIDVFASAHTRLIKNRPVHEIRVRQE